MLAAVRSQITKLCTNFLKPPRYIKIMDRNEIEWKTQGVHRYEKTKNTILPIPSFQVRFVHGSTGGGVGAISLPLSLRIVATAISQWQWGRYVRQREGGWEKQRMRAAASFEALNPPGVLSWYMYSTVWLPGPWVACYGLQEWTRLGPAKPFSTTSEWYIELRPIGIELFQPDI